jgi:hypothetical protein
MYHRQTSTGLLNKRKSGVTEPFLDSSLAVNEISTDRKFATVSSADTNITNRNRLSMLFDEEDPNASSKYILPRKSSLRASRNFSANPQRISNTGSLRGSPAAKGEPEGRGSNEYTDQDRGKERALSRNKDVTAIKVYDSDVSDNKETRIVRKSSTGGKMRPKSRALKSPPPPLNLEGPPNVPNLSQKYAMYSPISGRPVVSERSSSLHPELSQPNQELTTTNKVKRHQSLGANAQNRPPRTSSHRHLQHPLEGDSASNDSEKLNEQSSGVSRKSLPASFRSRSRVVSTSEKSLEVLVGELDIVTNPDTSHSTKRENRKSSGSLRRTPSRVSISEYQGYTRSTSSNTHRISISSSPPPSRSSSAFGDVDDSKANALDAEKEAIPPVPPVPKHHSFFNKGIESLKLSHSRNSSTTSSKDASSDDGSNHHHRQNHNATSFDGSVDHSDANHLSYRNSNGTRQKPSAESNTETTYHENFSSDTENTYACIPVVTREPIDRRKYLDDEVQEMKKVAAPTSVIENKPLGKAIVSRRRGKVRTLKFMDSIEEVIYFFIV